MTLANVMNTKIQVNYHHNVGTFPRVLDLVGIKDYVDLSKAKKLILLLFPPYVLSLNLFSEAGT